MAITPVTTQTLFSEWRIITNAIITALGDNTALTTTEQVSLVGAINELDGLIGDLTTLGTTAQDTIVNAVNEILTAVGDITTLTTVDQSSTVAAIIELVTAIGTLSNLTTTDQSSLINAINEIDTLSGDLLTLTTDIKGDVIASVLINSGGTGYTNGDVLTIVAGNSDATITVTSEAAGVIDGISLTSGGTGYANAVGVSVTGGTGTLATFDIVTGTLTDAINEVDALVAALIAIPTLTIDNIQVNNLELNKGRLSTNDLTTIAVGTFSVAGTTLQAHNAATLAQGDAFYDDNITNGGLGSALATPVSQLLTAMGRTELRYGYEFYLLDVTASTGTADGQTLAINSQNYYPVVQNNNIFLSRVGNTVTWSGWVKAQTINDDVTFTGVAIGDANVTTYIDGNSVAETAPKLLTVADGWVHVRQTIVLTKEYNNIFPAIYANNLDNMLIALPVLLDGDLNIGLHKGIV